MSTTPTTETNSSQYIGLMSGTSLDGIDGVRALFSEHSVDVLQTAFIPYSQSLRRRFEKLFQASHNELHESQVLAIEHSRLANEVVQTLIEGIDPSSIAAIGNHGQTVRHHPNDDAAYSLQLGSGAYLAQLSKITTTMDFRNRDIAAGGQGAPLVPAFHQAVFSEPNQGRTIVNIGGIANISILDCEGVKPIGFDTGPGNTLMDEWTKRHLSKAYDENGAFAKSGAINQALLSWLMSEPFIKLSPPKSTGRDLFNLDWLTNYTALASIPPNDVQATLCEFTVLSILSGIQHFSPQAIDAIYVCGGGAKNSHLMSRLEQLASAAVDTTMSLGLDPQAVEACAFAWLAKQLLEGKPANAPSSTGARNTVPLGAIFPA
jgi:anhydro-N-acetylmuramic acid kinase